MKTVILIIGIYNSFGVIHYTETSYSTMKECQDALQIEVVKLSQEKPMTAECVVRKK